MYGPSLAWPSSSLSHKLSFSVVVSDDKTDSPLTVQPSSDLLALKLRQATEKASPHTGEGRIVRKAREHMEQAKKQRQVRGR